jgi:superfamily I DNA and/or RNA helicase
MPEWSNKQAYDVAMSDASPEEAEAIAREIERLVGTEFTDEEGSKRVLRHEDILVVAPYNAQVRCLRNVLPPEVSIGTVDKFEGQQAPVVFFSMTTSSSEDLPRGIEFLFSRNASTSRFREPSASPMSSPGRDS